MINKKPLISFDYAIKYLLKDKGDYEIVEGFLSALLCSQGYGPVKIVALLESESNREQPIYKRSLADLIVEDEKSQKYIIEIERNLQENFIHKACFNTSRLIVDNLSEGADYSDIVKIFHISILYFPLGNGSVYHGKTVIREVETKEPLSFHIKDPVTNALFDTVDILPEYFFISVPKFNDVLEKEIDDWLYVLKHSDVPATFHSPYMAKVADKLSVIKMTQDEYYAYLKYKKQVYTDIDSMETKFKMGLETGKQIGVEEGKQIGIEEGKQIGIEEGKQIGIEEGKQIGREETRHDTLRETAKNMKKIGLPNETIHTATGLSLEEIESL